MITTKRAIYFSLALLLAGLILSGCSATLPPKGWPGAALADDTVYTGSRQGKVVALKSSDGSLLWEFPPQGAEPLQALYGEPAIQGKMVYVGAYNGRVYALSTDKGKMEWQYPAEGHLEAIVGSPIVVNDLLFIGSSDGKIYAIDLASGQEKWRFPTGNKVWSTPAVANGVLYVGSTDRKLYALEMASGRKLWEFTSQGSILATPLIQSNAIYIGSFDRYLYALDMSGKEKWRFRGGTWFWSRPVVVGDTVYAANLDGKLYLIDAKDGRSVKQFELAGGVRADLLLADNSIFAATESGQVYSLGTERQNLKLFFKAPSAVVAPLASQGGKLYIYDQNGSLDAVDIKSGDKLWTATLAN